MRSEFFRSNRERLSQKLDGDSYVLTAYTSLQRSADMAFGFDQEANFWWLTGIEKPNWQIIYDGKELRSWLVQPEIDDVHKLFDGGLSPESAQKISGADEVINRGRANELLKKISDRDGRIYTLGDSPHASHYDFVVNPEPQKLYALCESLFSSVLDCRAELSKLRAIKQPEEIEALEKAVSLTVDAFENIKSKISDYKNEYEIEADFTHYFRSRGAKGHAYDPIVASDANACTLHYVENQDSLSSESLVLLDIGARVDGYAADITRTYSISQPTERQRQVHDAVVSASNEIIKLIKPGISVIDYQNSVDDIMRTKIFELGLVDENSGEDFRQFFPHSVSHGLGVDVHDSLGAPREFLENMVLTVEPGIYIPDEGIGVRIEDDILVTNSGNRNLSASLSTDW